MQDGIRMPAAPLWRRLFIACAICSCLVVILYYSMATSVAFGQNRTPPVTKAVSAQSSSLVLTTSALSQFYLPLINTKPVPKQRIAQIDEVTVMVLGDEPPRLRITAYGTANTDGWRNPELVLRSALTTVLPAMPAFDFIGEPPAETVLPMLRPVSASVELAALPLVSGVRVYAMNNAKETHLEGMDHANILLDPRTSHAGDNLQIIVHGIWHDGCVPAYQAHQLLGYLIPITTTSPILENPKVVCGQAVTPWNFVVAVGALSAGVYTVTVSGAVTATTTFTVADPAAL